MLLIILVVHISTPLFEVVKSESGALYNVTWLALCCSEPELSLYMFGGWGVRVVLFHFHEEICCCFQGLCSETDVVLIEYNIFPARFAENEFKIQSCRE